MPAPYSSSWFILLLLSLTACKLERIFEDGGTEMHEREVDNPGYCFALAWSYLSAVIAGFGLYFMSWNLARPLGPSWTLSLIWYPVAFWLCLWENAGKINLLLCFGFTGRCTLALSSLMAKVRFLSMVRPVWFFFSFTIMISFSSGVGFSRGVHSLLLVDPFWLRLGLLSAVF